jgi:uncharacterized protein
MAGLFVLCQAWAEESYAPWPEPDSGYVTDIAGVLSDSRESRLEQWLLKVEQRQGTEIIVVTIRSISDYPGTTNQSIESFATGLFDRWGIGNLPRNDGILLLIAIEDRKARIELGAGYGRARDRDAERIMQNVITPQFRKGNYGKGITDGVEAIIETFTPMKVGVRWDLILIPAVAIATLLIGMSLIRSGRRGWGWVFVGFALILFLAFIYLLKTTARASATSGTAGGSGGFGGGSSGGGGATGSW